MMTPSLTTLASYPGEKVLGVLIILLMLTFVGLVIASPWIQWFRQEMKYINIEIQRHVNNPREQAHWKRRKRRLLKSLIPGIKYE